MQLPHGSFRTIKKREKLRSLLDGVQQNKFSGITSITSKNFVCTLVFRMGQCVLAESQTDVGDAAWENALANGEIEIDAVLSDLDPAQIALSLDFNNTARVETGILESGIWAVATAKKRTLMFDKDVSKSLSLVVSEPPLVKEGAKEIQKSAHKPPLSSLPLTTVVMNAPPPPDTVSFEQPRPQQERAYVRSHKTAFEKDIDTFDMKDLEDVTEKIRKDCHMVVRHLQLEHLVEK